jgi:precorrin-6Y C5,15-methyltransferase (decarboxylating)
MDVVGVPASGWDGLGEAERGIIASAEVLLGGRRHLDLVPETPGQSRIPWPSPLHPGLAEVLVAHAGSRVVALASGDPLVAGIGSILVDLLGAENVRIHPAVSSVALARARMRWPAESVVVVRLVDPGASRLRAHLAPGRRIVVLSRDETSPADVASTLVDAGFGDSIMVAGAGPAGRGVRA